MNQMNFGLNGCPHFLRANLPTPTAQQKQFERRSETPTQRSAPINKPNARTLTSSCRQEAQETPTPDLTIRSVASHSMLAASEQDFAYHSQQLIAVQQDGRSYCFRLYGQAQTEFTDTVARVRSASPGMPTRVFFRKHDSVLLKDIASITFPSSLSNQEAECFTSA